MPSNDRPAEPSGFFSEGGGVRGAHVRSSATHAAALARYVPPSRRPDEPKTARSRISASKPKPTRQRQCPLGPTPERLAKGDVDLRVGMHRAVPTIERLRDQGRLDHNARENQGLFEAGLRLQRHFQGMQLGVQAQDLGRVRGGGNEDPERQELWVHHHDTFEIAKRLMGWDDHNEQRGCARVVIAIVCQEMTVGDAAAQVLGPMRKELAQAVGMDRLRQGLWALAVMWRLI